MVCSLGLKERPEIGYPDGSVCPPIPSQRKLQRKRSPRRAGLAGPALNIHARKVLQINAMAKRTKPGSEPRPGQPISLKTLGEYLNLSPATISLVLNNAPGVRSIPQDTRNRVTEAAAKFDYRPSFYARSLRKRQTFSVGVLVPELSDSYATQVLAGVEEGVPVSVISASLYQRFESRDNGAFTGKILSAMRSEFGGHAEKKP